MWKYMGIYTGLTLERVCVQFFRKKGKNRTKKGRIFENFGKNVQNLKIF